jgi:hypothetical protein
VIGKVLSRNLFELRDGSAQRVLRRLANCRTDGVSHRSGAQGLLGVGQDQPLTRPAGETAGSPPAQQANTPMANVHQNLPVCRQFATLLSASLLYFGFADSIVRFQNIFQICQNNKS